MEVAGLTKEKIFEIVIHTITWGLLFCSPFLFAYGDNASVSLERYVGFVIMPLTFMTVFYVNYGILTPRLLFRKRLGRFILANLLLIAAVLLIQHIWHEMCRLYIETEPPRENRGDPPPVYFFIAWNAMLMALTVGLAVAIRMTGNWYRIEAEKQQIEKERTQAELKNLKSQLNPHFLFNTLNNIYALIPIDRTKAQFAVHSLSHMLRYVLYENNQNYIPLEKEIQFVRNYVELMELRLPCMVMCDCILRILPGVIRQDSSDDDSFSNGLLEYPQYTRPEIYDGKRVPDVLLSGHHANIKKYRHEESLKRTAMYRPDLLENLNLNKEDQKVVDSVLKIKK